MNDIQPEGLEVPLHRSIVDPMLMMGLPRTVAFTLWTTASAFAFGLRQVWVLPLAIAIHAVCAAAAKSDPYFFDVFIRAVKTPPSLNHRQPCSTFVNIANPRLAFRTICLGPRW